MGFVHGDFQNFSQDFRQWSLTTGDSKKNIKYDIEGVPVTVVFTRMLFKERKLAIPNRISICTSNPRIEEIFKKNLWQPIQYFSNWDRNVWIFTDELNITHVHLQFELRFFTDPSQLNKQLDIDEKIKKENHLCFFDIIIQK